MPRYKILSSDPNWVEKQTQRIEHLKKLEAPRALIDHEEMKRDWNPDRELTYYIQQDLERKEWIKNNPMREEVVSEIYRRFDIMREHTSNDEGVFFGYTGSPAQFAMGLCVVGVGTTERSWMDSEYRKPAMTNEEFYMGLYDDLLDALQQQILD